MPIREEYLKAGGIASEVRDEVKKRSFVGRRLVEVCEFVEGKVREMGGEPAFPCNICLNDVAAHYTPLSNDSRVITDEDIVKVDIGVHVQGYIADTAVTFVSRPEHQELIRATESALNEAISKVRVGVEAGELGRIVSKAAAKRGFKPISNLSGHLIEPYTIHAGKSVPNVWVPNTPALREGEVYAVEPFLTTASGSGYVTEGSPGNIYALVTRRRLGDERLDKLVETVWGLYKTLPFTPRWLSSKFKEDEVYAMVAKLVHKRVFRQYPILVEGRGGVVAQAEHTIVPSASGVIVLTSTPASRAQRISS